MSTTGALVTLGAVAVGGVILYLIVKSINSNSQFGDLTNLVGGLL